MPAHESLLASELFLCLGRYGGTVPPVVVCLFRRRDFLDGSRKLLFQQFAVCFQFGTGLFNITAALFHGFENAGDGEPGYGFAAANPLPVGRLVQLPKALIKAGLHLVNRLQTAFQPFHFRALRL
jgi:hypothetical protein